MKTNTLEQYTQSIHNEESNVWKILGDIAKEAGEDPAAGKQAVLDMVILVGLRNAIQASSDKDTNVDRYLRESLSRLNERYPFDIVQAEREIKKLYANYQELVSGWNSLLTIQVIKKTLVDMACANETEQSQPTPAQMNAFDYL